MQYLVAGTVADAQEHSSDRWRPARPAGRHTAMHASLAAANTRSLPHPGPRYPVQQRKLELSQGAGLEVAAWLHKAALH